MPQKTLISRFACTPFGRLKEIPELKNLLIDVEFPACVLSHVEQEGVLIDGQRLVGKTGSCRTDCRA